MRVSIITCTRNSASTLDDTIDSVQLQTHTDIEHVFVDGCSTDGTLEMIARRCPNATVLRGVTGGISRAMNAGAAAATGTVIAHLHSDDYYAGPGVVAEAVTTFQRTPALQWLFGRISVLRDGKLSEGVGAQRPFSPARFRRGAASVPHPAVFIRRAAFDAAGGFDENLRYAMDIDLWLRLAPRTAPLQLDAPFAVFREHAGSLSTANVLAARAEARAVYWRYWKSAPFATMIYVIRCNLRTHRIRKRLGLSRHGS